MHKTISKSPCATSDWKGEQNGWMKWLNESYYKQFLVDNQQWWANLKSNHIQIFWDKDLNHVLKSQVPLFFQNSTLLKANLKSNHKSSTTMPCPILISIYCKIITFQLHFDSVYNLPKHWFWYSYRYFWHHIQYHSHIFALPCSKRKHTVNKYIHVTIIWHWVCKFTN